MYIYLYIYIYLLSGLKTAKGTKQLKLDPSIYENIQKERVEVGDVIYIESNSGAVKRQVFFVLASPLNKSRSVDL